MYTQESPTLMNCILIAPDMSHMYLSGSCFRGLVCVTLRTYFYISDVFNIVDLTNDLSYPHLYSSLPRNLDIRYTSKVVTAVSSCLKPFRADSSTFKVCIYIFTFIIANFVSSSQYPVAA